MMALENFERAWKERITNVPVWFDSVDKLSDEQTSGVFNFIQGYVYGVASQKRYIGQVHRFGALCTAPNSVHWCTEFSALVHRI